MASAQGDAAVNNATTSSAQADDTTTKKERHFLFEEMPKEDPNPKLDPNDSRWTPLLPQLSAKWFEGRACPAEDAIALATGCRRRLCFCAFGDSLTEHGMVDIDGNAGWVTQLSVMFRRRADVFNRGMSGYNTRWAKQVLNKDTLLQFPIGVELAIIWLGANDTNAGTEQHVPCDEYASNMREIINFWQKRCRPDYRLRPAEVVVLSPPPVIDGAPGVQGRSDARNCEYARIAYAVAREMNVHFINVHASFHAYPEPVPDGAAGYAYNSYDPLSSPVEQDWPVGGKQVTELLQEDGVHLTAKGQARIFELLKAHIVHATPHMRPIETALDAPPWNVMVSFGDVIPFETVDPERGADS